MADLVHRHVLGGEHAEHAGQGLRLGGVDLDDAGARVLGADGRAVRHVGEVPLVDVVGVLAVTEDLATHVHAEGALAHAVVVAALEVLVDLRLAAQHGGGELDALDDLLVAGAAAHVAADGPPDLVLGGVGVLAHEGGAAHHHAGDAEAALHGAHGAKRVDEGLLLLVGEPLDGEDLLALGELGGHDAALGGDAVDDDGACAAGALRAAVLHGGEVEVVTQEAQERLILAGRDLLAVDVEAVGFHLSSSLEALGDDAEGVVDDPARTLGGAHAAGDARLLVHHGEVLGHVNGVRGAGALARPASDAARLAHRACGGAGLVVRAEHLEALAAGNHVDDVLLAQAGAQATANAGVTVDVGDAVLVKLDRVLAAGGNARSAADATL